MGASQTKTAQQVVNDSIISAMVENVNNCSASVSQTQQVQFSGFGFGTSVKQNLMVNGKCLQEIKVDNDLINKMADKIIQDAQSQAIALMPSYSGSDAQSNLRNHLETHITNKTVQDCAVQVAQMQQVSFSGVQIGAQAQQTMDMFQECMQKALTANKVAQDIVVDVDQKATSKVTNPFDFLSSIFSNIVLGIIGFIILIIVIVIGLRASGGKSGKQPVIITQSAGPPIATPAQMEAQTA